MLVAMIVIVTVQANVAWLLAGDFAEQCEYHIGNIEFMFRKILGNFLTI